MSFSAYVSSISCSGKDPPGTRTIQAEGKERPVYLKCLALSHSSPSVNVKPCSVPAKQELGKAGVETVSQRPQSHINPQISKTAPADTYHKICRNSGEMTHCC